MLAPAVFALHGGSANAQSTTTYQYVGNPFTLAACEAGIIFSDCVSGGSLTAM
jgi:hypothetical protein